MHKRAMLLILPLLAIGAIGWLALTQWRDAMPDSAGDAVVDARTQQDAVREEELDRAAKAAAVALIDAESAAVDEPDATRAEAPPGWSPAATAERAQPVAPDGFSIADSHGEMRTAPLEAAAAEARQSAVETHAWLAGHGGVEALAEQAKGAGRDWTFGWLGVAPEADIGALTAQLDSLGATVLDRAGGLVRMRLPADAARLQRIAELDGVAGLAATPQDLKVPPALFAELAAGSPQDRLPAFVTLMADDADGRWRRALEAMGATVGLYDRSIRVYAANIPYNALRRIASADFVLAVEGIRRVKATHATAMPAVGADAVRMFDASSRTFSGIGGTGVPVGVLDTGFNINHRDLATHRRSICGGNFAGGLLFGGSADLSDEDLWVDVIAHGSHVAGTMFGNGSVLPRFAGVAPLVEDVRIGKVIAADGLATEFNIWRGMDYLGQATACGHGEPLKPLVVNASLGLDGVEWDGRTAAERKLDSVIWNARQLYVVAQANSAFSAFGNFAAAKNSLAVGASHNRGDLAEFSSHGPSGDGRLLPHLVAPGVDIVSAAGDGSYTGYIIQSGTSMASPAVAGVAALVMGAVPDLHGQPAAVRARLMASAIRPDAFLDDARRFPTHNGNGPGTLQHRYGLGKVSARTSVLDRDQDDGWVSGSAVLDMEDGYYGYQDVEVPEGASRLDIVMTWDERPADAFAGTLLNDLDLWVDHGADCGGACGEGASRSSSDNVEWLILRDPAPGTYRLKVIPRFAHVDAPRAALAWTVIRGPSTPQLAVSADSAVTAEPGRPFEVQATVSVDGYVAAGTVLRLDCRADADSAAPAITRPGAPGGTACNGVDMIALRASDAGREDGLERTLRFDSMDGIVLGEVAAGEEQTLRLLFNKQPAPTRFRLFLTASAWNADGASAAVDITVGEPDAGAPPGAARPGNDNFASAERLTGTSGDAEFDLLLATPEPGEPAFAPGLLNDFGGLASSRRPRSVWYRWTAPATDTYRFTVAKTSHDDIADDVQLDLFALDRATDALVAIESTAANSGGGMVFAATRRQAYVIRASIVPERLYLYGQPPSDLVFGPVNSGPRPLDHHTGLQGPPKVHRLLVTPLALHWSRASQPPHDDFALAAELDGMSGTLEASNQGATLQRDEPLTPLSGTVWHRWTAPPGSAGDWTFAVDRRYLNVAAFTGEAVDDMRLVSGLPAQQATFPVQEGMEYRIAVAAGTDLSGTEYTLSWGPGERMDAGNDDLAGAEPVFGVPASLHFALASLNDATVEPGEPVESGVRTRWWTWQAPFTGRYTWRADAVGDAVQVAVFEMDDAGGLMPLAGSTPGRQAIGFSFPATAGRQYAISAGAPPIDSLMPSFFGLVVFEWGPSPSNDDLAHAEQLDGASGAVFADNTYATMEAGEIGGSLGDSSLWWTWQTDQGGWYRFAADDIAKVAVYRMHGDGLHNLELVATSRWLQEEAAVFRAEAGVRYAIRAGTSYVGFRFPFELRWEANGRPSWLGYLGSYRDADVDADGNLLELVEPAHLAFNTDGSELYVATAYGLQVFSRDERSGALMHSQMLDGVYHGAMLLWSEVHDALLAGDCSGWHKYAAVEGGGLEYDTPLLGAAPCASYFGVPLPGSKAFTAAQGGIIHLALTQIGIETYRFDGEDALEQLGIVPIEALNAAVLGSDEAYLYAATGNGIVVFAHDAATGALEQVGGETGAYGVSEDGIDDGNGGFGNGGYGDDPIFDLLATDQRGRYLFGITADRATTAFSLADPAAPEMFADFPAFGELLFPGFGGGTSGCHLATVRERTPTVDVFCNDAAFSIRVLADRGALRAEDHFQNGGVDRFGRHIPALALGEGIAASPDGRHIYASDFNAVRVFERAGSL